MVSHSTGIGNLSLVADYKQNLQNMVGHSNFLPTISFAVYHVVKLWIFNQMNS